VTHGTFQEPIEADRLRVQRDNLDLELRTACEEASSARADRGHLAQAIADLMGSHEADRASLVGQLRSAERFSLAEMRVRREAEQARDKAEAELRTIERRAGGAVGAIKPDGTTVEINGALDAVATLDVYARNLKTRADKAEAEAAKLTLELEKAGQEIAAERNEAAAWKAAWEENSRAQLQAQKRKRKDRR